MLVAKEVQRSKKKKKEEKKSNLSVWVCHHLLSTFTPYENLALTQQEHAFLSLQKMFKKKKNFVFKKYGKLSGVIFFQKNSWQKGFVGLTSKERANKYMSNLQNNKQTNKQTKTKKKLSMLCYQSVHFCVLVFA